MKRVWIFTLAITILMQSASLDQLFKIPVLFQHFTEHQLKNSELSFLQFLSVHYWENDNQNQDDIQEMKLPLEKNECVNQNFQLFARV